MSSPPTLQIKNVTKTFRDSPAVSNLSLSIAAGDVYALLGPNGAGKTTTINMILGFVLPDSGEIWVEGRSVQHAPLLSRSRIAYLPEMVALYPALTGVENLHYFALLAGKDLDRQMCRKLLTEAGLQEDAHDQRASDYSKGMRQKVGVAVAHDLWRVREAANRIGILKAGVLTDEINPKDVSSDALQNIYVRRQAA